MAAAAAAEAEIVQLEMVIQAQAMRNRVLGAIHIVGKTADASSTTTSGSGNGAGAEKRPPVVSVPPVPRITTDL